MKNYLIIMALSCATVCGAIAAFNYHADPYGIYPPVEPDREHLSRINQLNHMRLTKPWYVDRRHPTAIVIGTSRTGSVTPQHPAWPAGHGYNLSVPGLTPYELRRLIEHAQANGPLQQVMIGLDFEALAAPEPLYRPGYEDNRLALPGETYIRPARRVQRLQDIASTLFSMPAAGLGLAAWSGHGDNGRWYYPDGTWEKRGRFLTGRSGYLYIGRGIVDIRRSRQLQLETNIAQLRATLDFCYRKSIDTRLFFTPSHVFLLDLWHRLGYADLWAETHRAVLEVNQALAVLHGRQAFPVWGFNDTRGVVDEAIIQGGNRDAYWYDDGVHFSRRLGARIMDAVWGDLGNFGTRLDQHSLKPYLDHTRELASEFERSNRELTDSLRREIGTGL